MAAGGPVRRWLVNAVRRRVWFVERTFDALRRYVASWTGTDRPRSVAAFDGWTNGTTLRCGGRVLATPPAGPVRADDSAWTNLRRAWFAWNSREVSGVRVRLTLPTPGRPNDAAPFVAEAVSDEEGYVFFDVAVDPPPPPGPHAATLDLPDHPDVRAGLTVFAADDADGPGLISDIDDTVLHTGVTSVWTTLRLTFFGNAQTRQRLPGVAELYRQIVATADPKGPAGTCPAFYVSSSPWNLHGLLRGFFAANRLPAGPLLLQDYGVDAVKLVTDLSHTHKLDAARKIVDDFPKRRFVLMGDSGQRDASLYATLAEERPGRIAAVLIRDVDPLRPGRRDAAATRELARLADAGVPALLAGDSVTMAGHLVRCGLLDAAAVAAVTRAQADDRDRPSLTRAAAAGAVGLGSPPGPTVAS